MESTRNPLIIGAGPAGLTAALELVKRGVTPRIYEASGGVGGLARTPVDGGWRVDPGGHRFFTRSEEISDLWRSLLPADQWIAVPRRSAMLVKGHFVRYPLVGRDLLTQMGLRSGMRGLSSLYWSRLRHGTPIVHKSASFREWGTYEFGRYWYNTFFDSYVSKTWLTDPGNITSDWANQRIKPIGWRQRAEQDREASDVFRYPRFGPGQLWDAAAAALAEAAVLPVLNSPVVRVAVDGKNWAVELQGGQTVSADAVFSSMPLRLLVDALDPGPPKHIRAVAAALKHRGLVTVGVALQQRYNIPFNWVYTPGPEFRVGRIQNYGRWSNELSPGGWDGTHLGFEYFLRPDDELLSASDECFSEIVEKDLRALGIGNATIERVMVVRSPYAYPVYDSVRERGVARIRDYLRLNHPSLHPMGRNGMHHYDNQDHAMLSALRSVERYLGRNVDPWGVNADRGHHESGILLG
ncbi:hypothetical protein NGTWS1803_28240 [Mycolicibacterium cyprinidarum]|nr:hypothetical protein NGTWS1803_28240 [Mycolicibacterium sp. NGTWS1803]